MAVFYFILIVAYVILFVVLMKMIRLAYIQVYEQVKCKVFLLFSLFICIMIFRWIIYLCLQFAWVKIITIEKLSGEIPFYISEILLSTMFIYFLTKVYDQEE